MKRVKLFCLAMAVLLAGCATSFESSDPQANYHYVFSGVRAPMPRIVHSRVDRVESGVTSASHNGLWEFEMIASPEWVEEVKKDFVPASSRDKSPPRLPAWFSPDEEAFETFVMQGSSTAAAHLYVERHPKNPDEIRVFVHRF